MPNATLTIAAVRRRLQRHKGNYRAIAKLANVSPDWVQKFSDRRRNRIGFEQLNKLVRGLDRFEAET
jgi:hypothetical protein